MRATINGSTTSIRMGGQLPVALGRAQIVPSTLPGLEVQLEHLTTPHSPR